MRITGESLMSFWRAFWVSFDHVVFTSFGSPYHLHELPSIPNYTNVYSNTSASQKAVVKFWLGEIAAHGKSPIKQGTERSIRPAPADGKQVLHPLGLYLQ